MPIRSVKSLRSFSCDQNAQSHSLSPKIRSVNPAGAKSGETLGSKLKRHGRASLEAQGVFSHFVCPLRSPIDRVHRELTDALARCCDLMDCFTTLKEVFFGIFKMKARITT